MSIDYNIAQVRNLKSKVIINLSRNISKPYFIRSTTTKKSAFSKHRLCSEMSKSAQN